MILKKRYNKGGKFSLKDLMQAYKATKPKRGKYSYDYDELGLGSNLLNEDHDPDNPTPSDQDVYIKNLNTETQQELLESGEIDKIIERRRDWHTGDKGANPTGGGGITIIKNDGSRKKYKGNNSSPYPKGMRGDEGGIDVSYREGTANPFKRLKAALLALKGPPKKYANPRFL
jgi:hypothetical protein